MFEISRGLLSVSLFLNGYDCSYATRGTNWSVPNLSLLLGDDPLESSSCVYYRCPINAQVNGKIRATVEYGIEPDRQLR